MDACNAKRDGNHAFFLDLFAGPDCLLSISKRGLLNLHACVQLCSQSRKEHEMADRQTFTCCVLCDGCKCKHVPETRDEKTMASLRCLRGSLLTQRQKLEPWL